MLAHFHRPLAEVPTAWLDVETTGLVPGEDAIVQIGASLFGPGDAEPWTTQTWLVNPGRPIPPAATEVHGITDAMVADAPPLAGVVLELAPLIDGMQPAAYNATFDMDFLPRGLFRRDWPWLDALTLVRHVDRYARGTGRHKLETACKRHGVPLTGAHDAGHDAEAAGRLFAKLLATNPTVVPGRLGDALRWFEAQRAEDWHNFHSWLANQPPGED